MIPPYRLIFLAFFSIRKEIIAAKKSQYFHSKVFLSKDQGRKIALKLVWSDHKEARQYLFREHEFIQALSGKKYFYEYRGHFQIANYYVLATQWVDGYTLDGNLALLQNKVPLQSTKDAFSQQCWEILNCLKSKEIIHRDIRPKNIIIRDGTPILVDFGWAVWGSENRPFIPYGLQNPDDLSAIHAMLKEIWQSSLTG